ncbi:hypothetical protein [Facilibium subflavum]|uniref:hypothetical protein n=1 Tax=Facilibium subflavum TaxID=2219058 RepID=UPI000E65865D|nr:hypothetical protein [Facilibium subflavum]
MPARKKKFSFLAPADADAPPKTPGYHDPNTQKYGLPQPQKPVIENEFYWKSTPDKDVQAPD